MDWDSYLSTVPNKSPEELEMDRLEKEYADMFAEDFGYTKLCAPTMKEALAEIKECIRTKTKQQKSVINLPEGAVI